MFHHFHIYWKHLFFFIGYKKLLVLLCSVIGELTKYVSWMRFELVTCKR